METVTKRLLSLFAFILMISVTTAFGQNRPREGTVGLRASLQSGQTNLEVPIWTSDSFTIAPMLGFVYEQNNFTTLNLGVKPRFYQSMGNNIASYLGLQGMIQYTSPEVGDEVTDIVIGANGGGEYFLDSHFSLGVEGQLNFLLRDNDDNRVSTGAAISGTYYF